jgi:Zn ribbon nucleic-acid-binding protein
MEKRKDVCPECGYKLTYKIWGNKTIGFCKQCGYEEN